MKKNVIDASEMRRLNKATVLNVIRDSKQTSRMAISQSTGINKATVSSIVDQLIEQEFVKEIGLGTSSGGRRPRILTFHSNAAFSIGVDIQIDSMRVVLANMDNEVQVENIIPLDNEFPLSNSTLLQLLSSEIETIMENAPHSPRGIIGVGVALPGIIDFKKGYVKYIESMELRDLSLATALFQQFAFPVYIDNDANCGAWVQFRQHSATKSFVYVHVGIGIGTGIVLNGELYRGRSGLAGEFGHMTINSMGQHCSCGNYGCWEQYASEQALFRYLKEFSRTDVNLKLGPDFVREVVVRADEQDEPAVRALKTLGHHLGIGIVNIVNTLDPEIIVLGGNIHIAEKYILPEIKEILRQRGLSRENELNIVCAPHKPSIGAAGIVTEETLIRGWYHQTSTLTSYW